MDVLKHFYLKYVLPKSYTLTELVHHYNSSYEEILESVIKKDDVDDFITLLVGSKIGEESTNELLSFAQSTDMIDAIISNSEVRYDEFYPSIMNSRSPTFIRFLLDKMIEINEDLGDVCYIIAEEGHVEAYEDKW